MSTEPVTGPSIEESVPGDYSLPRPPPDAPNVVLIVLDDLGFGQLGCFGSGIATPAHRPAGGGWPPVQPVPRDEPLFADPCVACSPAATTTPWAWGSSPTSRWRFPATRAGCRRAAATLPRLLRDAGYNTMAVGKWHLVPGGERSHAGPFDRWPLGFGFERYYGFLQGDTNHWSPHLVQDNDYVEPPRTAAEGYHLTEDLADHAIRLRAPPARGGRRSAVLPLLRPGRDARAAPRRPRMDRALPRNVRPGLGALARRSLRPPAGHGNRARGHVAPAAPELDPGMGCALLRRAADARPPAGGVRRIPLAHRRPDRARARRALEKIGVLDDTLVMLVSDNGASGEGGALGTFNEHRFTEHVARDGGAEPRVERRARRACAPIPTTRGAGRGRETPRCGSGSATRGSAARARR